MSARKSEDAVAKLRAGLAELSEKIVDEAAKTFLHGGVSEDASEDAPVLKTEAEEILEAEGVADGILGDLQEAAARWLLETQQAESGDLTERALHANEANRLQRLINPLDLAHVLAHRKSETLRKRDVENRYEDRAARQSAQADAHAARQERIAEMDEERFRLDQERFTRDEARLAEHRASVLEHVRIQTKTHQDHGEAVEQILREGIAQVVALLSSHVARQHQWSGEISNFRISPSWEATTSPDGKIWAPMDDVSSMGWRADAASIRYRADDAKVDPKGNVTSVPGVVEVRNETSKPKTVQFPGAPPVNVEWEGGPAPQGERRATPINPEKFSPSYYHGAVCQCIDLAGCMPYNVGTAFAYIWRAGRKTPCALEDLRKARVHLRHEHARIRVMDREEAQVNYSAELPFGVSYLNTAIQMPDNLKPGQPWFGVILYQLGNSVFGIGDEHPAWHLARALVALDATIRDRKCLCGSCPPEADSPDCSLCRRQQPHATCDTVYQRRRPEPR